MKTLKISLPFLSEIVYKKKTKHLSGLTYNKDIFVIELENDIQLKEFLYLWKANIQNYLLSENKENMSEILAERTFHVLNSNFIDMVTEKIILSDYKNKIQDLCDMSKKIEIITSQRMPSSYITSEELSKYEIIKDYVNTEKEIIQNYLNNFNLRKNKISLFPKEFLFEKLSNIEKMTTTEQLKNNFFLNVVTSNSAILFPLLSYNYFRINNVEKAKILLNKIHNDTARKYENLVNFALKDISFIIQEKGLFGNNCFDKKIINILKHKIYSEPLLYNQFVDLFKDLSTSVQNVIEEGHGNQFSKKEFFAVPFEKEEVDNLDNKKSTSIL